MKNSLKILNGLLGLSIIFAAVVYANEIPGTGGVLSSPTTNQVFHTGVSIPVAFDTEVGNYYTAYLCSGTTTATDIATLTGGLLQTYFSAGTGSQLCVRLEADYLATGTGYSRTFDEAFFQASSFASGLGAGQYQIHVTHGCSTPLFGTQNNSSD